MRLARRRPRCASRRARGQRLRHWLAAVQMRRRRRKPRPGVTAAATTAVLATGEGPGLTAFATTAVSATGWPMTPTPPARAALSGMSVSFGGGADQIGLDRGDDGLDR